MVALDLDRATSPGQRSQSIRRRSRPTSPRRTKTIAVTDSVGNVIAYVPEEMGDRAAQAHAAMFAEAARLLDLVRFAARHIDGSAHPGLLRAYKAYCQDVLDRIDDAIVFD